jgi:uncharacterized phage protein gp47/JayE
MADVYNYIISTGTIVPDTADIQAEVITEFQLAFGADLITTPNTPQGLLITGETLARASVADNNAALANQINPNIAGGIYLDAICGLMGIERIPATATLVSCNLTGVAGTVIPQSSQAQDTNGNIYASISAVTLAIDGTATVTFQSLADSAITVAANDLNIIVAGGVLGWETVTNPAAQFSIGSTEQSDSALRLYRNGLLAIEGMSTSNAIIAGVLNIAGVTSMTFLENIAPTTETIDGVSMVGHSIYACVAGTALLTDIASVLQSRKSAGAAYNNSASSHPQSIAVTDPFSGQIIDVLFDTPDLIPILVNVTVHANSSIQDPTTIVKTAIVNYATGLIPGEPGLVVGADVSCFELSGAINISNPGIFVSDLQIKKQSAGSFGYTTIPIAVFEQATISSGNIAVTLV